MTSTSSPRSGSSTYVESTGSSSLGHMRRPSKRRLIRRVMEEGVLVRGRYFVVRGLVIPVGKDVDTRWRATFAIPRAAGGAVARNRLRRRLRAVVDEAECVLPDRLRMVVSYHPKQASFQELAGELRELLVNLGNKVGGRVKSGR